VLVWGSLGIGICAGEMCPFRLLMIFICSMCAIVGGYLFVGTQQALSLDLKERLIGGSYRVALAVRVIKGFGALLLFLIHFDVFMQLGYSKTFLHSALGILK